MEKKFNLDKIAFIGRSFTEYMKIFNLNERYLKERKILDCPAGASSFTVESLKKGYDVTAVDIAYDNNDDMLQQRHDRELLKIRQSFKGVEDMYVWNYFKSVDDLVRHREVVCKSFIEDYCKNIGSRYIKAELPKLPFKDNEFSLILCSHFLFLYDDRLNYAFHKDCIKEMLRVAKEVRIFPLTGLNGQKSLFVDKIIGDDLFSDVKLEILKVPYEFLRGANEMLRFSRRNRGYLDKNQGL